MEISTSEMANIPLHIELKGIHEMSLLLETCIDTKIGKTPISSLVRETTVSRKPESWHGCCWDCFGCFAPTDMFSVPLICIS